MGEDKTMDQHKNIVAVETEAQLYSHRRRAGENMVVLRRPINGEFNALAQWLHDQDASNKIRVASGTHFLETRYTIQQLQKFKKNSAMEWPDEMNLIISDMQTMQDQVRCSAELRVVGTEGYHPGTYVFHQDNAGAFRDIFQASDRLMCSYNAPTTEWIREEDAIAVPRDQGLQTYRKADGAPSFHTGVGDIWRLSCNNGQEKGLIHCAVETRPDAPPRLLAVC